MASFSSVVDTGIRDQLREVDEKRIDDWARTWRSPHGATDEEERRYVLHYLERARDFVESLAAEGRGMVYLIG